MKYIYEHEFISPVNGLSIKYYFCNVQQNPLHWHSELELICCISGTIKIMTPSSWTTLNAGELILINQNDVHKILGETNNNTTIVIQFDLASLSQLAPKIKDYIFECNSTVDDDKCYRPLRQLVKDFIFVLCKKEEGYFLELEVIRNKMVLEFMRNFKGVNRNMEETKIFKDARSRLVKILEYIENNYQNPILLTDIAKKYFISPYYLSHFFHEKLGISYRKYLAQIRIYHARQKLLDSKLKLIDIGTECGFSNPQSFTRAFKNEFKVTPSEYRNKILQELDSSRQGTPSEKHSWTPINPHHILKLMEQANYTV